MDERLNKIATEAVAKAEAAWAQRNMVDVLQSLEIVAKTYAAMREAAHYALIIHAGTNYKP